MWLSEAESSSPAADWSVSDMSLISYYTNTWGLPGCRHGFGPYLRTTFLYLLRGLPDSQKAETCSSANSLLKIQKYRHVRLRCKTKDYSALAGRKGSKKMFSLKLNCRLKKEAFLFFLECFCISCRSVQSLRGMTGHLHPFTVIRQPCRCTVQWPDLSRTLCMLALHLTHSVQYWSDTWNATKSYIHCECNLFFTV